VRLYKEDEEEERGVGAGEEFEGACKRRHGGGSDLNFYLLLESSSAHLSPISLCLLPSLSTQPDERRIRNEERERERMYFPPPFPFPFAFCILYLALVHYYRSCPCLVNNSMTTWRQRTGRNFY
jgi:hypothetical protein